ncbi:MAG: ubiquitin family protein [Fimbriimonadaceae bacterium]
MHHLKLIIEAPVGEPWTHEFDPELTVHGVIVEALHHFKLGEAKYELRHGTAVLEPHRTLESYHFSPDTILELVPDQRGGV